MIVAVALLLTALAVAAAWMGWRTERRAALAGAIASALGATLLWCRCFGTEIGIPLAIETGSLAALAFILGRIEIRPHRAPRAREIEAEPASTRRWLLGTARAIVAGPLGLAAAMGIGIAFAVTTPLDEQTRLILAGLIVPSLWAAFLVWSLATQRLARTAGGLAAIGTAGFALAMMPRG